MREATSHAASYNRHMLTTRCRHRFAGFLLACWAVVQAVAGAIKYAESLGTPPLISLIEDVYAQPTANLREQLAELLALPRQKLGHG